MQDNYIKTHQEQFHIKRPVMISGISIERWGRVGVWACGNRLAIQRGVYHTWLSPHYR